MPYIGRDVSYGVLETQTFPTNGSDNTFDLLFPIGSESSILLIKDGVTLKPVTDYQLANGGTQIVVSGGPLATPVVLFAVFMAMVVTTSTVTDNSITPAKLTSGLRKGTIHDHIVVTATDSNLTASNHYFVSSATTITVNLPANPTLGDTIKVTKVAAGNVIIARNGSNINGAASNIAISVAYDSEILTFVNTTVGWCRIS